MKKICILLSFTIFNTMLYTSLQKLNESTSSQQKFEQLSERQIQALTTEQIQTLTSEEIKKIKPISKIDFSKSGRFIYSYLPFLPSQISNFDSKQTQALEIDYLSLEQIDALNAEALTSDQIERAFTIYDTNLSDSFLKKLKINYDFFRTRMGQGIKRPKYDENRDCGPKYERSFYEERERYCFWYQAYKIWEKSQTSSMQSKSNQKQ